MSGLLTREEVLENHLDQYRRCQKLREPGGFQVNITSSNNVKPTSEFAAPPPLSICTPIHIRSLKVGTTHRKRVLRGTLQLQPVLMVSISCVLEDELGDVIPVALYNQLSADMEFLTAVKAAESKFPPGRYVAIIEPYLKLGNSDGRPLVRVDSPAEIVFLDQLGPGDAQGWQAEGKQHFAAQEITEARRCYDQALALHNSGGLVASLLLNIAACHIETAKHASGDDQQAYGTALHFAASAIIFKDDGRCLVKAYFRAAVALHVLGLNSAALFCCLSAADLDSGPAIQDLLKSVRKCLPKKATAGSRSAFLKAVGAIGQSTAAMWDALRVQPHAASQSTIAGQKEQGNQFFRSGEYKRALESYLSALSGLRSDVSTILANLAACHLKLGEPTVALVCSVAALALEPCHAKAHYRRVTSLMELEWLPVADDACRIAMQLAPQEAALAELQQRVVVAQRTAAAPGPPRHNGGAPNRRQDPDEERNSLGWMTERELKEKMEPEKTETEKVALMNRMLSMFAPEKAKAAGFLREVEPFHTEFAAAGKWPVQCDVDKCHKLLWDGYENACAIGLHELGLVDMDMDNYKREVMVRLGGNDRQRIEWWVGAAIGDVKFHPRLPYNKLILHSFSNAPNKAEMMTRGHAHVAVGFVDLGSLSAATLIDPPKGEDQDAPLRWVGYEASPYCVAKTLVLLRMMTQGAHTDDVLQVWYSATWSHSALRAFRTALTSLLSHPHHNSKTPWPEAVLQLLRHWQLHNVPLTTARERWLDSVSECACTIANFKHKGDRVALSAYIITGDVLPGEVGSVVMFSIPSGFRAQKAMNECFLQTIQWHELMACRERRARDIVSAGVMVLQERIDRLKEHIQQGRVQVEVNLGSVEPDNSRLQRTICSLKPWSMSWSNICDYYDPHEFHRMARACSAAGDTVHYMYTMNWARDIKGAMVLDYMFMENGQEFRKNLLKAAKDSISQVYRSLGWHKLFVLPPFDHAMNITDYSMFVLHHGTWADEFFKAGGVPKDQVGAVDMVVYNVICRTASVCSMTYTYDPDLQLLPRPAT